MSPYGGGVQSMIGVTGAQRASAEASTTMEIKPRLELRSKSVERENITLRVINTVRQSYTFNN